MALAPLSPSDAGSVARDKINAGLAKADLVDSKASADVVAAIQAALSGKASTGAVAAVHAALASVLSGKADRFDLADKIGAATSDKASNAALAALARIVADKVGPDQVRDAVRAVGDQIFSTTRPGDDPRAFTASADGGASSALQPLSPAGVTQTGTGSAYWVGDGGVVASRAPLAIEPGHAYRVRMSFRRMSPVADPSGDAVRCGLVVMGGSKSLLSGSDGDVVLDDVLNLGLDSGLEERVFVVALSSGPAVTDVLPSGTRYVRPYVKGFGTTNGLVVETIASDDITDAISRLVVALADPDTVPSVNARLTLLEEATPDLDEVAETVFGTIDDFVGHYVRADRNGVVPAGFASVFALTGTIYVPPGTYRIASEATWVAGRRIIFADGAKLSVDSGVTLRIETEIVAGAYQIFSGAGTVISRSGVPEWYGAKGDYNEFLNTGTDDTVSINKFFEAIGLSYSTTAKNGRHEWCGAGRKYLISDTINVPVGNANNLRILGGGASSTGTAFYAAASFTAGKPMMKIAPNSLAGGPYAEVDIRDLSFNKAPGSGATIGLQIGDSAAAFWSAITWCEFRRVVTFDLNVGFKITNFRKGVFTQCEVWAVNAGTAPRGMYFFGDATGLSGSTGGGLLGDITIRDCQFNINERSPRDFTPIHIRTIGGIATDIVAAGFRIEDIIAYSAKETVFLDAQSGSIRDVWFHDNQSDRSSCAVRATVTNASLATVGNVHIYDNYQTASENKFVEFSGPGESFDGVFIHHNWPRGGGGGDTPAIDLSGVQEFVVDHNELVDAAEGDCAIRIHDCRDGTVTGNVGRSRTTTLVTDFIRISGTCSGITTGLNRARTMYSSQCVNDTTVHPTNVHASNDDSGTRTPGEHTVNIYYDGSTWRFIGNGYGFYTKHDTSTGMLTRYKTTASNAAGANAAATLTTY